MSDMSETIVEHIPSLRRYALALLRNRVAADDLVQDCLTRALDRRHLFTPGTNLRAWLFTILHNCYISQVRRAMRHADWATVPSDKREQVVWPNAEQRVLLAELERSIDRLPAGQRSVLMLTVLEGMSNEETAAVVGIPVGTVKSRLCRARAALHAQIIDGDAARFATVPAKVAIARAGEKSVRVD